MKIDDQQESEIETYMKEVELLKELDHPNIVRYEGFLQADGYVNIILEYMESGSLSHQLRSYGNFSEKLAQIYVLKILEGLDYLHARRVVHRDLKAANILAAKDGSIKLTDFGVSMNLMLGESELDAVVAGTPNWMAPEIIELEGATTASDIWSLGCTVVEFVTGFPPYSGLLAMTTLFRIVEDDCPPLPEHVSPELTDFLHRCFKKVPSERATAKQLMGHPWLKEARQAPVSTAGDAVPNGRRKTMASVMATLTLFTHMDRSHRRTTLSRQHLVGLYCVACVDSPSKRRLTCAMAVDWCVTPNAPNSWKPTSNSATHGSTPTLPTPP
jgi:serine/threonine protein kinase